MVAVAVSFKNIANYELKCDLMNQFCTCMSQNAHPEHEDYEVEAEFAHEEEVGDQRPELRNASGIG